MINENDYLKSKFSTFLFVNICDKCYTGDKYWTLYVRPNSESILLSQKSIYGFILMQKQSQNTNYENY